MPEKSRLRIMHVLFSRGFSGSERSTAESCNEQAREHDVCVVLRKGHRRNGISIVDNLDSRVRVVEISPRIFTLKSLRRAIIDFSPDIVHCHLRRGTRLVAKINPRAVTVSTLHIEVNGPHFLQMNGLICNARWQVEKVPKEYKGQIFKANNSVVKAIELSPLEVQELRSGLGVTDNEFLIGAVGRYHPSKGWDTLITAFKSNKDKNARLLFFGSGTLEGRLKKLASGDDRIRFVGYRKDVKLLYQAFDLLICPSRYEPLPRVILEAMEAGAPVLASDVGGCAELIEDYGGWLFPADDVDALVASLNRLIEDAPERYRPDLSAHYIENANASMINFYRSLMNQTPKD